MNLRYVAIAAAAVFIAGCNTMHGAGEDIKAGERNVEGASSKDEEPANDPTGSNRYINTPSTPNPTTSGTDADRARSVPDTSKSTPPTDTTMSTPQSNSSTR